MVVIGAVHVDLVVAADRLPGPGDTVVGSELVSHGGGKGANAALAARRIGTEVTLLGAVGDDEHAAVGLADLEAAGVRVDRVRHLPDAQTGTALIVVDAQGQNQIAVAPGAGQALKAVHIAAELDELLAGTDCLLVSTEVAPEAVAAAVEAAAAAGVICVLNCAPPYPGLVELLSSGPILTPNQHELVLLDQLVAGYHGAPATDPAYPAVRLAARTGAPVVVTLGADGALVAHPDNEIERVPAPATAARDTTGAGDTFNGVLAAKLAGGTPLLQAVRTAVVAASMSVREPGARAGMPTAESLSEELPMNLQPHH
ncbi:ribokinase [Patulibacter sp. NPDC049589]|uniref:ribokinase n=1 Tax=Patulibacter sp. NPDC049589 TaxID=3154731 RepID=UPI00344983B8